MNRILMQDKKTGLTVSVPEEKLEQFQSEAKERSPELETKLERAWELLKQKIYEK